MALIENETFRSQVIEVDGKDFDKCGFFNCTLVYRGGKPPTFTRCSFRAGKVQIEGQAARTTKYLERLNTSGLSSAVDAVIDRIETGGFGFSSRPKPPPRMYTGDHYGRLGQYAVVMAGVVFVIMAFFWFGNITAPYNQLDERDDVQPFSAEYPLSAMPALPDELADFYDGLREAQVEQISTYQWIDESAGTVQIPVEDAIQMLLDEQNMAVASAGGD